jgi:hypothetical protein
MYDLKKIIGDNIPVVEFDEIFTSLKPLAHIKKGRPGQRFNLEVNNKRMCFILYAGTCLVKRAHDALVLSTINGPSIVGLQDVFHAKSDVLVYANTAVDYALIPISELFYWIDQQNLWKNLCYMLMLSSTRFSEYQKETVGISNYELICNLLHSLSKENLEIRMTTTALEYIQTRSMLSRSGIMKILSTLKSGGYINTSKGLLISINSLPKRF